MSKTCILFTKNFPFGQREHYLLNEIPFLLNEFNRIVIIPVDEYSLKADENRMAGIDRVEVVGINRIDVSFTASARVIREMRVWGYLLWELLLSREKGNMISKWSKLLAVTRHLYRSSQALTQITEKYSLHPQNAVFYHYWFHNGLLLTHFFHRYFSSNRFTNVARAHSGDLYHRDWNTMQRAKEAFIPFEQLKWREVDQVFAISTHGLAFMNKVFPQFALKTAIARLGVMDNAIQYEYSSLSEKVIVTCTHISPNKRIHRLPEILHFVSGSIRWVHFGGGSPSELETIGTALKTECPNVVFDFRGAVSNDEIISFYRQNPVHLIINLSEAEGIPVALMEAASYGIPMLATATIGNPEIVNESNGILIPVNFNPKEVASQIVTLISDPTSWRNASRNARKTFEELYEARLNYVDFAQKLKNKIH